MNIATGLEAALHNAKLPVEICEEAASKVCTALQHAPKPRRNLPKLQLAPLKSLKKKDIVVLESNKGNVTVVIDREDYHQRCLAL